MTPRGRYLLGVLGGPAWGGNWSNLTNELLSDTGTDDGIHPIHPETGAPFEFICSTYAMNSPVATAKPAVLRAPKPYRIADL
jgi:hypothetical protein